MLSNVVLSTTAILNSKHGLGLLCWVALLLIPNSSTRHRGCCRDAEGRILEVACSQKDGECILKKKKIYCTVPSLEMIFQSRQGGKGGVAVL